MDNDRYGPWNRWFAWHPVQLNYDYGYGRGPRVCFQVIERAYVCCHAGCMWYYRLAR